MSRLTINKNPTNVVNSLQAALPNRLRIETSRDGGTLVHYDRPLAVISQFTTEAELAQSLKDLAGELLNAAREMTCKAEPELSVIEETVFSFILPGDDEVEFRVHNANNETEARRLVQERLASVG
ncbi:hypothetical protein N8590_03670 [bacterium]|nr:hypothetical protein [bacterium]